MFDSTSVLDPAMAGTPGPGCWERPEWSTYLPDGMLADILADQSPVGSQWERLERIGAWERIVSWAQAHQLREMARFAECVAAEWRAVSRAGDPLCQAEPVGPAVAQVSGQESAAGEISLRLRVAPVTAASRLAEAQDLTGRFPQVMDALAAGRITLPKARVIAEQTEQLSETHARAVAARVRERASTRTPGQLRRVVRRAVIRTDPAAVRRRHAAAKRRGG